MEAEELWMTVRGTERLSAGEKRPLPQQAVDAGGLDAEEWRGETRKDLKLNKLLSPKKVEIRRNW